MKIKIISLLLILSFYSYGQVAINNTATAPDPSAVLDVSSTSKGLLIPRMSAGERDMIVAPVSSLMIFNTTTNSYNYYSGSTWLTMAAGNIRLLSDSDNDTKIQVEASPDEDTIRFAASGVQQLRLDGKMAQLESPGKSLFLGRKAGLIDDGTDNFNLFIGYEAGKSNLAGSSNTFIGQGAGDLNTASKNTFIGKDAGGSNITGAENIFIGEGAGAANNAVSFNTFVGTGSGNINFNGGSNTFLGHHAGFGNVSGSSNTFVGSSAGAANTAANNTFVGKDAGLVNTGGSLNTFVGMSAGDANTIGGSNTFLGQAAGGANVSGVSNTFLGQGAGLISTTDNNTFIGKGAGNANTTGSDNTCLGKDADLGSASLTNATAIGANTIVSTSNSLVLGNGANVGIGISSPGAKLDVAGTTKFGVNGTVLTEIIKTAIVKDVGSVAANSTLAETFSVPNCDFSSTVYVSTSANLESGLVIAYARVSSAGTVTVGFANASSGAIDPANRTYYITVIR